MNSCIFQCPLLRFPLSTPSPSSSSPSKLLLSCSFKSIEVNKRQSVSVIAPLSRINSECGVYSKRRAVLILGISILPFLGSAAGAFEGPVSDATIRTENQQEQSLEKPGISNQIVPILNSFGIYISGPLVALYALARKEKKAVEATVESLNEKLEEREAAIVGVRKEYEAKLLVEQEKMEKQLIDAQEEQLSLLKQLRSANELRMKGGGEISRTSPPLLEHS